MDFSYFNFPGLTGHVCANLMWAVLCGGLIGVERAARGRQAGMRTYAIVSLAAACMMTAIAQETSAMSIGDPASRVIQGLLTGLGFLGAGVIMQQGINIKGLTTAASIWLTCGIGIVCGLGQWGLGVLVTAVGIALLAGFKLLEERLSRDHFAKIDVILSTGSTLDLDGIKDLLVISGMTPKEVAFRQGEDRRMAFSVVAVFERLDCPPRLAQALRGRDVDVSFFEISSSPDEG